MAAGPLYITRPRSEVIDYSVPFLHIHATLLQLRSSPWAVHDVHDLPLTHPDSSSADTVNVGCIESGMLVRSFRMTNDTFFSRLFGVMRRTSPSVFTDTNKLGIERVRQSGGHYAYILPDMIGDYISRQRPCDLTTTGKFLMRRSFGLGVQKDSGLMSQLNRALRRLRRDGELDRLYRKWWIDKSACDGIHSSKIYSLNGGGETWRQHRELSMFVAVVHIASWTMGL